MRLALLLALLATSAAAQTPDSTASLQGNRLTRGQRVLVMAAGVTAGMLITPDDDQTLWAIASPVAAGLAVYGAGRLTGHRGRLVPTMAGAAVGALPALALFTVSRASPNDGFWWYVAGATASVVGPAAGAVVGFDRSMAARPVVLVGPAGERTPGLSLTIAL